MFKWFSNILSETKPQGRSAFRIALVILGVTLINIPIYSYIYAQNNSPQLSGIISANIVLGLAMALSALLAWDNRHKTAVDIIIFGVSLFAVFIVGLISDLGLILSITVFIFSLIISGQTLTNKEAPRVILIGLGFAVIALVGDMFIPWQRLSVPLIRTAITYLIVIIFLLQALRLSSLFAGYSLRTKLTILLVGVSFISISLVAFVANRVVSNQLNKTLAENLTILSQNNAAQVGDVLEKNFDRLNLFVLNQFIQDSVDGANDIGIADPGRLSALDVSWKNLSDTNTFVRKTQNNPMAVQLREFKIYYPDIKAALITDKNGALIAATDRSPDYYQADETWWQNTWNNGQGGFYISQPIKNDTTGIETVDISISITGHNRTDVIGVMQVTLSLDRMNTILAKNRFGKTGRTTLVFSPTEQYIDGDSGLNIFPRPTLSEIKLASDSGKTNTIIFDNTPSLISVTPVESANPRISYAVSAAKWLILVHQDQTEVQAPLVATSRTITLIALALLLVVGFIAYFIGNQFTRPIEDLTNTATLLAEGDLYARANTESQDEIGILARTLNSMSTQVRDLVNTLEQRVAYRTKVLETSTKVGRNISTILDEKTLIREVVEQVKHSFEYYHAQIYLIDEKTGDLVMNYGSGEAGQILLARGHKLAKGVGLVGRAAETNTAIWVSNTTNHPIWKSNPFIPDTKSEIALPISIGDTVLGVLDVQEDIADSLQQGDVDMLQSIANQAAAALQNARSYAATQQKGERESLITSISQKIQETTSVEKALQVALRELGHITGAQISVRLKPSSKNMEANPLIVPAQLKEQK